MFEWDSGSEEVDDELAFDSSSESEDDEGRASMRSRVSAFSSSDGSTVQSAGTV